MPEHRAQRYRPGSAIAPVKIHDRSENDRHVAVYRFRSEPAGGTAGLIEGGSAPLGAHREFELHSPAGIAAAPAPLVIVAPILGGSYIVARTLCGLATANGCRALFLHRTRGWLRPELGGKELENLIVREVRDNRRVLDWAIRTGLADRRRIGSIGVSLGAIRNVALIAADLRLAHNLLVLGGADLPRILLHSTEPKVVRYRNRRMRQAGWSEPRFVADLEAHLASDPLRVAAYVDPRRVECLFGLFDSVVPFRQGQLLWKALGRPRACFIPAGHYDAILWWPHIRWHVVRLLDRIKR